MKRKERRSSGDLLKNRVIKSFKTFKELQKKNVVLVKSFKIAEIDHPDSRIRISQWDLGNFWKSLKI